ncbi:hypothetical protein [Stutzerimonas stutzeri]|uniref:hypothetical protein n=1 Tax=Stutzerimonas stutzeri TaxID=316 RepID=UPI0005EB7158|nr:hypothetical protein [Stutzerimonas stutzeri]
MNAIEIAKLAVADTESSAPFVSAGTRELMAFGKVAMVIEKMDAAASLRAYRLEEAMNEVRILLANA